MDLQKVVLVARWEFISAVTRRMYIFAVVAMPVIYGLMLTAAGVTGTTVARGAPPTTPLELSSAAMIPATCVP